MMKNQEPTDVEPPFPPGRRIHISVADQRLDVLDRDQVVLSYPISTSKFGLGAENGSYKTPVGNFIIEEKIGAGAAAGAIFKERQLTGTVSEAGGEEDRILTRILWLGGCDDGNANTRQRYIYIHGTNQEDRIGTPASHGCIRMRNEDIIELFASVDVRTPVSIEEEGGFRRAFPA